MRSFAGRDILSLKEFERQEFFRVFEIAERLEVSEGAVKASLRQVFGKLARLSQLTGLAADKSF